MRIGDLTYEIGGKNQPAFFVAGIVTSSGQGKSCLFDHVSNSLCVDQIVTCKAI